MKILLAICFVLLQWSHLAAQKESAFFNSSKVSVDFVGLDFSNAKLVGVEDFSNPAKIQSYYFPSLNGILLSEMRKYDVKGAFYKNEVNYYLGVVEQLNQQIEYIDLVVNATPAPFTDKEIQKMVRAYDNTGLESDYGVSFIVHSLNKFQERAYIYVVVFNPKNKKVLFSQRMSGEAAGIGFRNYWARTVYDVIKQIKTHEFRAWRKQYKK